LSLKNPSGCRHFKVKSGHWEPCSPHSFGSVCSTFGSPSSWRCSCSAANMYMYVKIELNSWLPLVERQLEGVGSSQLALPLSRPLKTPRDPLQRSPFAVTQPTDLTGLVPPTRPRFSYSPVVLNLATLLLLFLALRSRRVSMCPCVHVGLSSAWVLTSA